MHSFTSINPVKLEIRNLVGRGSVVRHSWGSTLAQLLNTYGDLEQVNYLFDSQFTHFHNCTEHASQHCAGDEIK